MLRLAKLVLAASVFSFVLTALVGCSTAKGVVTGVGAIGNGMYEDVTHSWDYAKNADDWMRKNLW